MRLYGIIWDYMGFKAYFRQKIGGVFQTHIARGRDDQWTPMDQWCRNAAFRPWPEAQRGRPCFDLPRSFLRCRWGWMGLDGSGGYEHWGAQQNGNINAFFDIMISSRGMNRFMGNEDMNIMILLGWYHRTTTWWIQVPPAFLSKCHRFSLFVLYTCFPGATRCTVLDQEWVLQSKWRLEGT